MKTRMRLALHSILFLFALVSYANAADQSFADQFLGSPLLILVSIIVIDAIAFVYHKIRK
jgi:cadmium resistance protein CadD (predicted permease)